MVGALVCGPLEPRHAAGLAALFERFAADPATAAFHPHPMTAAWAEKVSAGVGPDLYAAVWRADAPGELLGYGMLRGWEAGFEVPSLGIAIDPTQRGQGLGLAMMAYLHAEAAARGAPRIRLKVYPDNVGAVRLYERLGYRFGDGLEAGQRVGIIELERSRAP
jgi:ribosomal protein S18 acetylase RimI-like enzyme